jgi:hypothetical protein
MLRSWEFTCDHMGSFTHFKFTYRFEDVSESSYGYIVMPADKAATLLDYCRACLVANAVPDIDKVLKIVR